MNNPLSDLLILAYFRSIYRERVEIDEQGQIETVPISTERLDDEELHLAWSHNGLHWTALNKNRPTWPGPSCAILSSTVGKMAFFTFSLPATVTRAPACTLVRLILSIGKSVNCP